MQAEAEEFPLGFGEVAPESLHAIEVRICESGILAHLLEAGTDLLPGHPGLSQAPHHLVW